MLPDKLKRSSHLEGVLRQRHEWEQVELNLNTRGKDASMNSTITKVWNKTEFLKNVVYYFWSDLRNIIY